MSLQRRRQFFFVSQYLRGKLSDPTIIAEYITYSNNMKTEQLGVISSF